jgi:hypothetical protein
VEVIAHRRAFLLISSGYYGVYYPCEIHIPVHEFRGLQHPELFCPELHLFANSLLARAATFSGEPTYTWEITFGFPSTRAIYLKYR